MKTFIIFYRKNRKDGVVIINAETWNEASLLAENRGVLAAFRRDSLEIDTETPGLLYHEEETS